MSALSDVFLMIGNPGVGKSTILNGLLGEVRFKSGLSVGSGMTYKLDTYTTKAGVTYADTPGLADTQRRQQAAKAITEALKLGGRFHVFFVVTLTQCRVSPEDATTIKLVLDAIPPISYGIIVNQLSQKEYEMLQRPTENPNVPGHWEQMTRQLLGCLGNNDKLTNMVILMKRDEELDGEFDKVKPLPEDVLVSIRAMKPTVIKPPTVRRVRADAFEEEREKSRKNQEEMNRKNQRLLDALNLSEKQKARYQEENEELQTNLQAEYQRREDEREAHRRELQHERQRHRDDSARMRERHEEEMNSLRAENNEPNQDMKLQEELSELLSSSAADLEAFQASQKAQEKQIKQGTMVGGVIVGVLGLGASFVTGGIAAPLVMAAGFGVGGLAGALL